MVDRLIYIYIFTFDVASPWLETGIPAVKEEPYAMVMVMRRPKTPIHRSTPVQ